MKRKFLAILFIFATCVLPAVAIEKVKIGDLYYNLNPDDRTAEVTSANNNVTSVNIPSTVEYNSTIYSVTSIGRNAFFACKGMTDVIIPNSVTVIGNAAFYDCHSLTSVKIPDSITEIGENAFCSCNSLTYINIPNSVNYVGSGALWHCDKLVKPIYNKHFFIHLPRKFYGSYTIPDGIKTIVGKAFYDCCGLIDVTIPNSVTSIGDCAFLGCCSLNFIDIPNSVTSIGADAFFECNKIKNPIYNNHCFAYLPPSYRKSAYTIPDGIEIVAGGAFRHCASMTSITIPNSVTSIGENAFMGCKSLKKIKIPNSVTSIGENAFNECVNLISPIYNIHCFAYLPPSYNGAYIIPEGLKSIAGGAFYYCKELTSITIPNSVISIGESAFCGCSRLTSITIPDSVTSIGKFAFYGCSSLTSVKIPNSITSIERYTFYDCTSLTSIIVPTSVTSIGDNAFCVALKELYYPQGLDISKAGIPSSTKLIAYSPTNSSTNKATASSRSTSDTNSATTSRTASSSTTSQSTTHPKNTYTKLTTSRPICTILSPKEGDPYSTPTIRLEYKIENLSEIESVKFYVNGIERKPKNNGSNKGVRLVNGTVVELEMPTENGKDASISIVVVDANNEERIVGRRKLKYVSVHNPTLHVFAVGVNKYKAKGFDELRYAEKDACDFSKTIIDIADKNMYERVDTTVILGSRANRSNILEQLMKLEGRVKSNDIVMLFFSGHGKVENDKSYFITSDAEYVIQGLATRDIVDQIELMKKRSNIFVFMDACHSGATKTTERTKGNAKPITLAESEVVGYYSCAEKEESVEDDILKNGVFTYALINSLRGKVANEGQITIRELDEAVRKWVSDRTKGKQSPTLDYRGSDYVLFYKKK